MYIRLLKKLITIFLLLQFVTGNVFAEQLIKLPKLFTHFYHHSHEHNDTRGFFDFLRAHYFDTHKKDLHEGEDKDCDLPFKHCTNCCVSLHFTATAPVPVFQKFNFVFVTILNKQYVSENEKTKSASTTSIWQPPKLV